MNNIILKLSTQLLLTSSFIFAESIGGASWYGEKFQGKPTASGEPFDMYAYTTAHRTYPFGTVLKVTNLKNGKSVDVRVNDRGPYKESRIVDLSYQAAKEIGIVESGVGEVKIEKKKVDSSKKSSLAVVERSTMESEMIQVQIASFSNEVNAEKFILDQPYDISTEIIPMNIKGKSIYKVVIVYFSKEEAQKMVKSKKYKGAYIIS